MKSLLLSVATLALITAMPAFAQEQAIGEKAPMITAPMMGIDGNANTLLDLKGDKGLLVIFSCNTCPFVVGNGSKTEGWEGRYNGLAELAESLDIGMVLVNSNEAKREGDDSLAAMKERAKEAGYTMPYVVDEGSKLANACGARTTPHVYLYNSKLELAYRGSIDDNVNRSEEVKERYLHMAMQRMAEGKKIKTTETKAIGCSIKRILRK
tara:strand:+ start:3311 stop:3940 length:630 start_codon:yes stop_codon:yes gene_type:complete